MAGSEAAADMAVRVYEWPRSRRLPVPPGDVGGKLAEPGARGVVDGCDRQRLPGIGHEPFDVQLDLIERAGAREHRPEVGDVVGRKVGIAEARRVLGLVGLEHLAHRSLSEVSYGEKRRVEIAMALAQKPRLLLLDEPLAGLSHEERATVKQLIAGIARETTVVMIEHDMDTALDLAERITVLHYGSVIVEGTRADVVADPKTREVYLGD